MKTSSEERLNTYLDTLIEKGRLESWTSFVEALEVPTELLPAMMTNRAELVKLVVPHAQTANEHAVYLKLIAGLIETNSALRKHSEHVAHLINNWSGAFKALRNVGQRIEAFAQFKHSNKIEEEDNE